MLVAAFEVEVDIAVDFGVGADDGGERGTAVEPYVHDIGFFGKFMTAAFAGVAFGQEVFGFSGEPYLRTAFFPEELLQMSDGFFGDDGFAAVFAVEDRDRHAPGALTGDAPVAAVADHVVDAVSAPGGDPLYILIDGFQRFFAEAVDGGEPLFRGAEEDRFFAAPAVGIGVLDEDQLDETAFFVQFFHDGFVAFVGGEAFELAGFVGEAAGVVHRRNDGQVVFEADEVVVGAVAGSGMNRAGTGFVGNMVAEDQKAFFIFPEGMIAGGHFQIGAVVFF